MSKFSFRTKALDASKPLPIYRTSEHPEVLMETININRAVPQMPTGMEKEEEEEIHIREAINQQSRQGVLSSSNLVIPTPEVESGIKHYEELYPPDYKLPKQYERTQLFVFAEEEPPEYDLDTEDEEFLENHNKGRRKRVSKDEFEELMDKVEKNYPISEARLQEKVSVDKSWLHTVFEYYQAKLKRLGRDTVMPQLKPELADGSSKSDPYVAFRRRVEKMQTRKNRQNQETQYINILKLRRDLERAKALFDMVKERETTKLKLLKLEQSLLDQSVIHKDWDGSKFREWQPWLRPPTPATPSPSDEAPAPLKLKIDLSAAKDAKEDGKSKLKKKKLKRAQREQIEWEYEDTSAVTEPEYERDDPFRFRRRKNIFYHAPLAKAGCSHRAGRYWLAPQSDHQEDTPLRMRGYFRRRVGRGGRIIIDRCHSRFDPWHELDAMDEEHESDLHNPRLARRLLRWCQPEDDPASVIEGVGGGSAALDSMRTTADMKTPQPVSGNSNNRRPSTSSARPTSAQSSRPSSAGSNKDRPSNGSQQGQSRPRSSSSASARQSYPSYPVAGTDFGSGGEDIAGGPKVKVLTSPTRGAPPAPAWVSVSKAGEPARKAPKLQSTSRKGTPST